MSFSWKAITDEQLTLPVDHMLHHFTIAASEVEPRTILDRLEVVSITLSKCPDPPEHEFLVIETKDVEDKNRHYTYIIERLSQSNDPDQPESKEEDKSIFTPDPHYPVTFTAPQLSSRDFISVNATSTSQAISDSAVKSTKTKANDRIVGGHHIKRYKYGIAQQAGSFKPKSLKLFDMIILAQAVHEYAPEYTPLDKNCYWFCSLVYSATMEIFGILKNPKIAELTPCRPEISGRRMGFKIIHTSSKDVTAIICGFWKKFDAVMKTVDVFFF